MEEKKYEHPSYGQLEVVRTYSSGATALYGSSIKHSNTIRLRLYGSYMKRDLNQNWYHNNGLKFEVEMSPTQWAEFISSINMGGGVPCTIKFDKQGRVESPPDFHTRDTFDSEFRNSISHASKGITNTIKETKEIFSKKSLNKADKEAILSNLYQIERTLKDTIPFIQESFGEAMNQTVHEAKGELEGWITSKVGNHFELEEAKQILSIE